MGTQPESKLSRSIIRAIRGGGGYAVKFHGGPMTEAGTPDILACIPCEVPVALPDGIGLIAEDRIIGRFVGIETKTPENHRDDKDGSPIQKLRAQQIRDAGGVVVIPATSVEQVLEVLDSLGWVRTPPKPPSDGSAAISEPLQPPVYWWTHQPNNRKGIT